MRANRIAICSTRPGRRWNREDISSESNSFGGTVRRHFVGVCLTLRAESTVGMATCGRVAGTEQARAQKLTKTRCGKTVAGIKEVTMLFHPAS